MGAGQTVSLLGFCEPLSSWLHLAGAAVAAWSIGPLRRLGTSPGARLALAVYGGGVVFALSMSGAYHACESDGAARAVMQRLDHAGIWILIAATFTPVHAIAFRGLARWGFLSFIWAAAITGVVLKTVFFDALPQSVGLLFYLALGWMGVVSAVLLARARGWRPVAPLLAGGVFYSVGGAISVIESPRLLPGYLGHHELFHLAVLAGVLLHWRFVAASCQPATQRSLAVAVPGRRGELATN
jgi:hemolysin III